MEKVPETTAEIISLIGFGHEYILIRGADDTNLEIHVDKAKSCHLKSVFECISRSLL